MTARICSGPTPTEPLPSGTPISVLGDFSSVTYGPFAGWTAKALATDSIGVTHLLWTNTNGQASLWDINVDGTYTHTEYGPFSGWTAVSVSAGM